MYGRSSELSEEVMLRYNPVLITPSHAEMLIASVTLKATPCHERSMCGVGELKLTGAWIKF